MDRMVAWTVVAVAAFVGSQPLPTWGKETAEELEQVARRVASDNREELAIDIARLRDAGPAGLDALFTAHAAAIDRALEPNPKTAARETASPGAASRDTASRDTATADSSTWARIRHALDEVGGQRDCHTSHLYWHTDLEEAKAVAKGQGKPILSLRLLGKLTDEFSCANSRFFRSTLYANQAVSQVLRERFVLHWQSVRPAPIVTIDFGDGRTLRRTVTGNSVHYILDASGRPINALPGLYGPRAFLRGLEQAEQISLEIASSQDSATIARRLNDYHRVRLDDLRHAWQADLGQLGITQASALTSQTAGRYAASQRVPARPTVAKTAAPPRADEAGMRAMPKAAVERPIVAAALNLSDEALRATTVDHVWTRIAALHTADGTLDASSRKFIARQEPSAALAASRAVSKSEVENPLVRLLSNLQQAVALDTVRNEYLLHRQIHSWFIAGQVAALDQLNERIYAELFLTPSSDPWLGLAPADTYTGLESGGVQNCPRD